MGRMMGRIMGRIGQVSARQYFLSVRRSSMWRRSSYVVVLRIGLYWFVFFFAV